MELKNILCSLLNLLFLTVLVTVVACAELERASLEVNNDKIKLVIPSKEEEEVPKKLKRKFQGQFKQLPKRKWKREF